jgi:hypothetical protein
MLLSSWTRADVHLPSQALIGVGNPIKPIQLKTVRPGILKPLGGITTPHPRRRRDIGAMPKFQAVAVGVGGVAGRPLEVAWLGLQVVKIFNGGHPSWWEVARHSGSAIGARPKEAPTQCTEYMFAAVFGLWVRPSQPKRAVHVRPPHGVAPSAQCGVASATWTLARLGVQHDRAGYMRECWTASAEVGTLRIPTLAGQAGEGPRVTALQDSPTGYLSLVVGDLQEGCPGCAEFYTEGGGPVPQWVHKPKHGRSAKTFDVILRCFVGWKGHVDENSQLSVINSKSGVVHQVFHERIFWLYNAQPRVEPRVKPASRRRTSDEADACGAG